MRQVLCAITAAVVLGHATAIADHTITVTVRVVAHKTIRPLQRCLMAVVRYEYVIESAPDEPSLEGTELAADLDFEPRRRDCGAAASSPGAVHRVRLRRRHAGDPLEFQQFLSVAECAPP